jgi:DNA-binding transcriptional LysR family regulator
MDRIEAMQAFVRVVDTGSFTRAAETLQASKTRVTQLVQQLESHLQVKLLHRTTRRVSVTADGAVFHARAVRLLADLDDAESSLSAATRVPRGRLRVDVPTPLASLILMPALPDFLVRYPDIQLDVGASDRKVDLIDENVDCVVRGGPLTEPSLRARHVADLPLGVYAAPKYLAGAGTPTHPQALQESRHRIVAYRGSRAGTPLPWVLRRGDEEMRVHARHALVVDDGNALLAAGVAGVGVIWLPHYMARLPLSLGDLVPLFEDWQLEPMPLYVAFPPGRHVSGKLRVFIDWIVEVVAGHAPAIQPRR